MLMLKPPKKFLVDSFIYREYLGEGDYNKPIYGDYATIENCRIDRGSQYTFSSSGKQLLYNAVIFCYEGLTTPLPTFKEQSLVIYDGKEHVITKVDTVIDAYSKTIYSYELEAV
ncbi:putative minor capsid protein [Enterococcus hirae]|uniref:putative minor capsid protein n=1 Tax=Enterococcus hirae TaxID=1354 RepID=UPI001372C167|nr:putative minor capsid protein [Enterococcus hirae]MCK6147340.1 minor capsid protein [Enterococcus hirae]MCK6175120.1 minor capsid protein [Enterococcus hirae]NBA19284.1 minor capsid protein [Enterococcus hirae]NBA21936.1 minor capsid protein [Enterococcus hirae]NBA27710.1 minor capsid protein [Enterococcus hirae]